MPLRGHKFKTSKENKRSDVKRFLAAFLAFALVFGSISAVVIIKHNDLSLKSIFSPQEKNREETTTEQKQLNKVELSGKTDFLIYCAASDFSEMYFLQIVEADLDSCALKVYPLAPDENNYVQILKNSGAAGLVDAVEKNENVTISRYVGSNAETFTLAINYMDGLKYYVPERIEYRTDDFTLILARGNQTIKGESLIKYFRYCKSLGESGLELQGKLVCAMLDSYVNAENAEKGSRIYQKLLSYLNSNSDISFFEAADAMPTIKAFSNSEDRQKSTVVLNSSQEEDK